MIASGIRFMYADVVKNFMSFTAVGVIIVAMLGVGVAESAGLIKALIRKLAHVAPPSALTYILVFVGILSSIAADAGYVFKSHVVPDLMTAIAVALKDAVFMPTPTESKGKTAA